MEPDTIQCQTERPSAVAQTLATLHADPRHTGAVITRPHPLYCMVRRENHTVVLAPASSWDDVRDALGPMASRLEDGSAMLVLLGRPDSPSLQQALDSGLAALLPERPDDKALFVATNTAFGLMDARSRAESRGRWLSRYRYELGELIEIARAITTERDIDKLLGLILEKSRFITGADAGSIYVVERDAKGSELLRFKLSQNESVKFDSREFTMPLSVRSMAGAAALRREPINIVDVYAMPADLPFGFDRSFDAKIGYRTKSVLCMPMVSRSNEIIGVIQLINKKRDPQRRLHTKEDVDQHVVAFDERAQELLATLATQAGVSLDNALLLDEIRRIFEGFVHASVEAIEQRDPTTSGHSRRVSELTVGLARAVERVETGPYREVVFSENDLRELEYASLLHDFGKIGVREQVLVKAKKLYPAETVLIRQRIDLALRSLEVEILSRKLDLVARGNASAATALDEEMAARKAELLGAWQTIECANEPTVLKQDDFAKIDALAGLTYVDADGAPHPLLAPQEIASLRVARGSLTADEIEEIQSHVRHTYDFLSTIPWGKNFRRVPIIAGAHHEKLNGGGYPNRLRSEEIPLQSKLMSIADIFDALTASDRPYKRAVPVEKALDILGFEVKDKHLDEDLVRIFREARVWEPVFSRKP
jgi:HD-GYP domain-containing protein (c-di-GMP phosphodiesterase class II)